MLIYYVWKYIKLCSYESLHTNRPTLSLSVSAAVSFKIIGKSIFIVCFKSDFLIISEKSITICLQTSK
jgi:hypothetical protein